LVVLASGVVVPVRGGTWDAPTGAVGQHDDERVAGTRHRRRIDREGAPDERVPGIGYGDPLREVVNDVGIVWFLLIPFWRAPAWIASSTTRRG